jgi:hypothetical protein
MPAFVSQHLEAPPVVFLSDRPIIFGVAPACPGIPSSGGTKDVDARPRPGMTAVRL